MWRALALLVLLAACADDTAPRSDLGASVDLSAASCADPQPAAGSLCPVSVSGTVVDEVGQPAPEVVVSMCAKLCFYGKTDAEGRFTLISSTHILVDQYAIEVHGRPASATYYTPLPGPDATSTFARPLPLPALPTSGPAIPEDGSAQTITSGDVTLLFAAGTKPRFSIEDGGPHGHELRARRILVPASMPFVDPAAAPVVLHALAPFEASFDRKVAVRVGNDVGLPAGSAVEVLVQRGLVNDGPPAGRFIHAALAHVSTDGTSIETDVGEGIVELTWIALRPL